MLLVRLGGEAGFLRWTRGVRNGLQLAERGDFWPKKLQTKHIFAKMPAGSLTHRPGQIFLPLKSAVLGRRSRRQTFFGPMIYLFISHYPFCFSISFSAQKMFERHDLRPPRGHF